MALRVQLHRFELNTPNERVRHTQSITQHILPERHPHLAARSHATMWRVVVVGTTEVGFFLWSMEPKDGQSWGLSGHLFQRDYPGVNPPVLMGAFALQRGDSRKTIFGGGVSMYKKIRKSPFSGLAS